MAATTTNTTPSSETFFTGPVVSQNGFQVGALQPYPTAPNLDTTIIDSYGMLNTGLLAASKRNLVVLAYAFNTAANSGAANFLSVLNPETSGSMFVTGVYVDIVTAVATSASGTVAMGFGTSATTSYSQFFNGTINTSVAGVSQYTTVQKVPVNNYITASVTGYPPTGIAGYFFIEYWRET